MRYLQVISSLDPANGGPADGVARLAEASLRQGHEVEIATLDKPGTHWGASLPCPVQCLGPALGTYGYSLRFYTWMQNNAARFQAVIVNGLWQHLGYATRAALSGSRIPYFVFSHGMLDPWFKRRYPLKHLKKLVYWTLAEQRVLRDASAVLFTCEEERLLARQSFGTYQAKELICPYGTPGTDGDPATQRETFLRAFPQLRGKRLLLFLGRIHPKKGCDLLIEAFARIAPHHPDLHLVFVGPDPTNWEGRLLDMARQHGVHAVTFAGMLRGDAKWGAFRASEAFVLPSHQENFGIAVVEALSCGVPVLISDKVNIWREIDSANAGLIADDTLEGASLLLARWLKLDALARQRMAQYGVRLFQSSFHIDSAATRLVEVLARHPTEQEVLRSLEAAR